ncbi:MAG: DegT/DnrJ/EryC1/StrS family aminotransferase [Candidatus Edwardsbacteria bacterium]|nr:DegT/DnrJ/EryC1/StrS family aminotransferase [Candidatus Edwardsbacteria bacterium]
MIKLASPDITAKEINAVVKVLKSGSLSLGPEIPKFEQAFARYVGRKHAVAVSSGTAALHLITRALGLNAGDEVITTPFSFAASLNCILYAGARPVLADIGTDTFNIDPAKVLKAITPRTKAILAVDVFGLPADYPALEKICRERHLHLIEDSCEALGASCAGRRAGSFGIAATFGFYPNKQITTGEGGMAVCDDGALAGQIRSLRNQGRAFMGGWMAHQVMGYNYRMSDIAAALGRVQLSRIGALLKRREQLARRYRTLFQKDLPAFAVLPEPKGYKRSWFVFVILVPPVLKGEPRDRLITELKKRGIQCAHYFPALHCQPYVQKELGYKKGDFPAAENIADRSLAIPFHHGLSLADQKKVVRTIKNLV